MKSIDKIYSGIKGIVESARSSAIRSINFMMVKAYWNIGKIIVQEEQRGKEKARYADYLLKKLSLRLTKDYGPGFDESNLRNMRLFYRTFPIRDAVRHELTWTHYRLICRVETKQARSFYLNESINSRWSTRELERQVNSQLFERLCLSRNKNKVKELSKKGQIIQKPQDMIKNPYILEFLGVSETIQEKDLEKAIIDKLQKFLLELGKGFSFVSRQKRITVNGDHHYIDLVFYNYILNCFFLIDLKIGKLTHQDIGQMDFYVRYFEKEIKQKSNNPTIGLILCSSKNEIMAKYTLLSENKQIFASKYELYLPSEEELKKELEFNKHS